MASMVANGMAKLGDDGSLPLEEIKEFLRTSRLHFSHPYRWGNHLTEE
jgi:hypothetical protein